MINWLDSENVNDFYLFIDIACFDRNEKLRSLAGKKTKRGQRIQSGKAEHSR